jgi:twinkle protein
MSNINDIINYLGNYKEKGSELMFETCPFCHGGQHNDKWKFFLNPDKETYYCQRGKCNEYGHISQLFSHFGVEYKRDNNNYYNSNNDFKVEKMENKKQKEYKVFEDNYELIKENSKAYKYLQLRKINKETIRSFNIKKDKKGNIIFPFYQKNKLVCIKYRIPRKNKKGELKTWQEKGGKPILFNYDNIDFNKPLIITEGEIDCMCVFQSGFKNVASIPFGTNNWEWIDLHWEELKNVPYFIILGDNDKPGEKFISEAVIKLGINRVKVIKNPYNDINEFLYRENEEKLKELIDNAKLQSIDGLMNFSDIDKFKIDTENRIDTGFKSVNKIIGGWLPGQFVILTGKRGNGKSTFASQVIVEAIHSNFNCCMYSGELSPEQIKNWLFLQILGENVGMEYDEFRGKQVEVVPDKYWNQLNNHIDNKLFLYDNTVLERKGLDQGSILKIFEYAYKRNNCKLFLVDNLMTARNQFDNQNNYYKSQGEFIGKFKQFANDFGVTVIFVAHPKKTNNISDFKNDDVAGSSENTDRADVVLNIQRTDEEDDDIPGCVLHILKNRLYGDHGRLKLNFISKCKQFTEPNKFPKNYIDLKDIEDKEPKANINNLKIENNLPWE